MAAYAAVASRVEAAASHAASMRDRPDGLAAHTSARMLAGHAIPGACWMDALGRRGPVARTFAVEVSGAGGRAGAVHPTHLPAGAGGVGH